MDRSMKTGRMGVMLRWQSVPIAICLTIPFVLALHGEGSSGAKDTHAFVTGDIPIAIRAEEKTKKIVQENCIHCHEDTVEAYAGGRTAARPLLLGVSPQRCPRGTCGVTGARIKTLYFYPTK